MSLKDIAGNPSYGPATLPDFTHMYAGVECSREEFDKLDARFKDKPVTKAGIESIIKVMRGTKGSPEILEPAVANSVEETIAQRALDNQEGGSHYKDMAIQPVEYITANAIPYMEGNVIKYVSRHMNKNGAQDIKKAIHFLNLILELRYPESK